MNMARDSKGEGGHQVIWAGVAHGVERQGAFPVGIRGGLRKREGLGFRV